jgi:predicted TIM-barrel fold metal-dependent hydrolase
MRNGFQVLDTDAHHMEPASMWAEYCDSAFADRAPRVGDLGGGRKGMMVEDEPITNQDGNYPMHAKEFVDAATRAMLRFERARNAGFDAASRLVDMDEEGVDAQVIYPTVGGQILGKSFADTELLAAVCRAYNNWSLEYAAAAPGRLRMAAMLPVQAIDLAVEEARRVAAAGAAAFYVRPNPVAGRNLHHIDNDPLWRTIEELGLPVCIHDSGSPYLPSYGERMETHTSGHILAHPFEAMSAMMGLIWFGVIERFPNLKIVHVEADAGWLPYWLQRMEQHMDFSGNAEHPELKRRPTEYFKSNFLVACRGDEMTLPAVVSLVGDDYVTFNTDYPHPDGTWPTGMAALEAQPIGQESVRKIYWDNAAELFGAAPP